MAKLRVLTLTRQKKLKQMAAKLCEGSDVKVDDIPPAYNVEKVKLLIVGISPRMADTNVMRFFGALDPSRAANVAFFTDAAPEALTKIIDACKEGGVNVIDDILTVKCGLFSSASAGDLEQITQWEKKIESSLS
ncbi:MAG: hypothetical protein ACI3YK_07995 [Eubacteriales bacterium]